MEAKILVWIAYLLFFAAGCNKSKDDDLYPTSPPHFLILNLAIGGHAGGDPTRTPFPSGYEIDYVRIYQLK